MENCTYIKEFIDIIKKLSPQNQMYMLTLARVAATAEGAIKKLAVQPNKMKSE